jgi:hypothetical protein
VRKLITYMMEDARTISPSLDLLFLAKAIERIGDHSKNIAELIIYLVEGKDVRHQTLESIESSSNRAFSPRPHRRGRTRDCRADRGQPAAQRLPPVWAEDAERRSASWMPCCPT